MKGSLMKSATAVLCAVFTLSATSVARQSDDSRALNSLVESERAFANTSTKIGARAAFMMYFADDAVVFRPHPVKYKEAMKNVPLPKNPLETSLQWEPIWADISRDGDLGYTTGPTVWTDHSPAKRPPFYGFYFSFWKKQANGEWKVVFDGGTEQPGPYEGSRALRSPRVERFAGKAAKITSQEAKSELERIEKEFLEAVRTDGFSKHLDRFLDRQVRIYREKVYPIVGIDSVRSFFAARRYLSDWKPMNCEAASSGDLGYTYGSYIVQDIGGQNGTDEKGYYLHGWKRDAAGGWKLVAEITSPLPPETPKTKQ